MRSMKKLGKSLDDISYLFLSSAEKESQVKDISVQPKKKPGSILDVPVKSICLIGDSTGFQNAFLVINLSLALARLGMRIAVVDMDEEFPCLNFFLGRDVQMSEINNPQGLIKEGPLGVKLIGLNKLILERLSDDEKKEKLISELAKIEDNVDLILIGVMQKNLSNISCLLAETMKEFLVLVPPDKNKMLNSYKIIKTIFHHNTLAKIGIVVINIDHMYEIEVVFNKLEGAVKKFLDKELYKYGFLFKIKPSANAKANIASFYDADLTACISNIAQIVVLRSNVEETVVAEGSFFKKIITDFSKLH